MRSKLLLLTHGDATGKTNAKLTPIVTGMEK